MYVCEYTFTFCVIFFLRMRISAQISLVNQTPVADRRASTLIYLLRGRLDIINPRSPYNKLC